MSGDGDGEGCREEVGEEERGDRDNDAVDGDDQTCKVRHRVEAPDLNGQ